MRLLVRMVTGAAAPDSMPRRRPLHRGTLQAPCRRPMPRIMRTMVCSRLVVTKGIAAVTAMIEATKANEAIARPLPRPGGR